MQTDILPTILNLFGIKYNKNQFIGEDSLDPKFKGVAFFQIAHIMMGKNI